MSGIHWARGSAWAAYTMSRAARGVPEGYLYPPMMHIWSSLRDQLAALKKLQKDDGLWGTVLDCPEAYGEVSATAGIAAAMVMQGDPLHAKYVRKALHGVPATIADNGRVMNVSGGTAVMNDTDGYLRIDRKRAQGWGQGLALALLAAAIEAAEAEEAEEAAEASRDAPGSQEADIVNEDADRGDAAAASDGTALADQGRAERPERSVSGFGRSRIARIIACAHRGSLCMDLRDYGDDFYGYTSRIL